MNLVIIPYQSVDSDTLTAMLEEFVTRDGTDYGEFEATLSVRVGQVRHQLESEKAAIVFDADEETFSIVPSEALRLRGD